MIRERPAAPALQILEDEINKRLQQIEREQIELIRSAQILRHYQDNLQTRTCPFCGGQMWYIEPLRGVYSGEGEWLPPNNLDADWECQECLLASMRHIKPYKSNWEVEDSWERANTPLKGDSAAVRLFRKYPRLRKVIRHHSRGHGHDSWYLLADDDYWYYFEGPAKRALVNLLPVKPSSARTQN